MGCSVADSNAIASGASDVIALNCALGNRGTLPDSAVTWGSTAQSRFSGVRSGDLRPMADSPALDFAKRTYPAPGDSGWSAFAKYFSDFASDSIDGAPWSYSGPYPIAGAYMEWAPVVERGSMVIVW